MKVVDAGAPPLIMLSEVSGEGHSSTNCICIASACPSRSSEQSAVARRSLAGKVVCYSDQHQESRLVDMELRRKSPRSFSLLTSNHITSLWHPESSSAKSDLLHRI